MKLLVIFFDFLGNCFDRSFDWFLVAMAGWLLYGFWQFSAAICSGLLGVCLQIAHMSPKT